MNVEFADGTFTIDAAVIAEPLGLSPSHVPLQMRARHITSVCERGVDDDAGRYRLTFFRGQRRLRLVVDDRGRILDRVLDKISPRPSRTRT